jgi:hypothetical protein
LVFTNFLGANSIKAIWTGQAQDKARDIREDDNNNDRFELVFSQQLRGETADVKDPDREDDCGSSDTGNRKRQEKEPRDGDPEEINCTELYRTQELDHAKHPRAEW